MISFNVTTSAGFPSTSLYGIVHKINTIKSFLLILHLGLYFHPSPIGGIANSRISPRPASRGPLQSRMDTGSSPV